MSSNKLTVFRNKHLFAEVHELRGDGWHETKRYNYGLEEDLEEGGGSDGGKDGPTRRASGLYV